MASADLQRDSQLLSPSGFWCRDHCPRYLLRILLFFGVISLSATWPLPAQTPPDWTRYTAPFTSPLPTDGNSAVATFSQRKATYVKYLACGQENKFLSRAIDPTTNFVGGGELDMLDTVTAKLQWLKEGGLDPCIGTFNVMYNTGTDLDFYNNPNFRDYSTFRKLEAATFDPAGSSSCWVSFDPSIFKVDFPKPPNPFVTVTISVTPDCLKEQISFVLTKVQEGDAYPGTDKLPCNIETDPTRVVRGDWDLRMKQLIRILYLDSNGSAASGPSILASMPAPSGSPDDHNLREYVQNELITVDGGPSRDSYSLLACGDNEKDTGSPQDREDENNSSSDFWDSVGDIFSWFLRRLLLILALLGAAALISFVTGLTGLAVAVIAAIGIAVILAAGQIPETENHRLMIESTRFLNNQLIIQNLGPGNASGISSGQNDVKAWLLNKFQDIAKNDFIEYNARPYHGLSLQALRNLADFSTDPDVRNGAQMLLEYSAAKFALGSNQGRRLVPFRRHFAAVDCIDGNPCGGDVGLTKNNAPAEIFNDFVQLGDVGVSAGLLYNGQTQQLPFHSVSTAEPAAPYGGSPGAPLGSVFGGALSDAISPATSQFQPNPLIADLAIRKDVPYLQRIHHYGYEIYSSSPSALITAGGIETDHAYHFMIGPLPISTPKDQADNLGAGVPTTVILTGDPNGVPGNGQTSEMTLDSFISFRGTRKTEDSSETFTDNLCVWRNFACGTNLWMPNFLVVQLDHNPLSGPHWYFLDSSRFANKNWPKFFIVFYLICPGDTCNKLATKDAANAGFLEVVDNSSDTLASFEAKVIQNNQPASLGNLGQGCLTGGDCHGHYHTVSGHDLELELRGHQDDSEKTGITSVDGVAEKDLDNWNFAEGDIISSQGDGVITISNPRLGSQLILDFSDGSHPCRRTGPNQPCTQQ